MRVYSEWRNADFARLQSSVFYINCGGRRSRKNFLVHWEGVPTSFALQYLYVLAFEPTFVEIRNIETGSMSQAIQGSNLCYLFTDTPPYPHMSLII